MALNFKDAIAKFFSQHGQIAHLKFVDNTKAAKGYAFVKFEHEESVTKVLGKGNFEIELMGPNQEKLTCMKTVSRSALMDRQIKLSKQKKAEKMTKAAENPNPPKQKI